MKKGKSSFLKNLIFGTVGAALLLSAYVFFHEENRVMIKDKIAREEVLHERRNKLKAKLVEVQKLTSEERIIKLASEELGMIRIHEVVDTLFVNKDEVKKIERIIAGKYE